MVDLPPMGGQTKRAKLEAKVSLVPSVARIYRCGGLCAEPPRIMNAYLGTCKDWGIRGESLRKRRADGLKERDVNTKFFHARRRDLLGIVFSPSRKIILMSGFQRGDLVRHIVDFFQIFFEFPLSANIDEVVDCVDSVGHTTHVLTILILVCLGGGRNKSRAFTFIRDKVWKRLHLESKLRVTKNESESSHLKNAPCARSPPPPNSADRRPTPGRSADHTVPSKSSSKANVEASGENPLSPISSKTLKHHHICHPLDFLEQLHCRLHHSATNLPAPSLGKDL
ncbi:hypothetical protein DH2020_030302 [Rehmannia glutinosa]|uniref:Uncharacterized protein n=1 Tax=Rehmannia glutinosa TaxID=99300 RepID=A0ABR0VPQ3_REHGL